MTELAQNAELRPSPEAFPILHRVEGMLRNGEDFGLALDFDSNIDQFGPSGGESPLDTILHPKAREAITKLRAAGVDVVIVSSRGGRDILRLFEGIPGGVAAVGSQGWEAIVSYDGDPAHSHSELHPRFTPYRKEITGVLGDVRKKFFTEQLGIDPEISNDPNLILPTAEGGTIVLQRKGYNDQFPEGIGFAWNMNRVKPQDRSKYVEALDKYYKEAIRKYSKESGVNPQILMDFVKTVPLSERDGKWYTHQFRPKEESSKSKAMIQLMREPEGDKRMEHFEFMPSHKNWVYSGDNFKQDGSVMWIGRLIKTRTKRGGDVIGIWTKPEHPEGEPKVVDQVVSGVEGNIELLSQMADMATKYKFNRDTINVLVNGLSDIEQDKAATPEIVTDDELVVIENMTDKLAQWVKTNGFSRTYGEDEDHGPIPMYFRNEWPHDHDGKEIRSISISSRGNPSFFLARNPEVDGVSMNAFSEGDHPSFDLTLGLGGNVIVFSRGEDGTFSFSTTDRGTTPGRIPIYLDAGVNGDIRQHLNKKDAQSITKILAEINKSLPNLTEISQEENKRSYHSIF